MRARRQPFALGELRGDRKFRSSKFGAPIFHHERFASRILQVRSQREPVARRGDDSANCENAFGLTFPEKRAVEFRVADKRGWLITNIDEVGGDHRDGKRDRDRDALANHSARRLDHHATGVGFCIRCFFFLFFVLRETRAGHGNREKASEKESEWAKGRMGEWAKSPFLRFSDSPIHPLPLWRQFLNPAVIGIGFSCLPDAAFALFAFA